jgi:tight adherence protein B
MLIAILIGSSIAFVTYVAMSMIEERAAIRKRIEIVASGRLNAISSTLDKQRIIAKLQKEQKELNRKKKKKNNLDQLLGKSGISYSKSQTVAACACLGIVVGLVVLVISMHLMISVLAGLIVAIVFPRMILGILIARREQAFINELPNALDILSRGLRAGMPLGTCLKQIAESTADPLKTEFVHVLDLHKLGLPLADAIKRMPERIDLMDLRFFTIVIEIQQRSGGNLAEIIENISGVIRGRKEMRAKVKALISEAKTSSYIIGAIPMFFAMMSFWSDPKAFSRFWTEPLGQILSMIVFAFYGMGILLFAKLARVRV